MVKIKAIIPLAGKGTRLRPHTYSKPKPLLHVAGKPVLGHILDSINQLDIEEIIFITGEMEEYIVEYITNIAKNYNFKATFVKQKERLGDGHAISMAKNNVKDDVIIVFVDTIFIRNIKLDIDNIGQAEGIIWTSKTDDPKRFGIVEQKENIIVNVEEKPENPKSDLAVIGLYYFKESQKMFEYLNKIQKKNITSKGEYRLADAIVMMIKDGMKLKANTVDKWLDCGKPETLLETNRYLLENGNEKISKSKNSIIRPPVYIEKSAIVENSVIGPYVSIADRARINGSIITNTIVGADSTIKNAVIEDSLIGRKSEIIYRKKKLNVGDSTQILISE